MIYQVDHADEEDEKIFRLVYNILVVSGHADGQGACQTRKLDIWTQIEKTMTIIVQPAPPTWSSCWNM